MSLLNTRDSHLRKNVIGNWLLERAIDTGFSVDVVSGKVSLLAKGASVEQRGITGLIRLANEIRQKDET